MSATALACRLLALSLALALSWGGAAGCGAFEEDGGTAPSTQVQDPAAPLDGDGPTLRLSQVPSEAGWLVVDLSFHPSPGAPGPRMMELWLGVGSGMVFESGSPSASLQQASKLFVARQEEAGLRVVVFSTSDLAPLQAGPIGRLTFRATGSGATTLSLQERMPIFAPVEANEGMHLPDLLTLTAGGAP